jgi:predicted amidophosphoribosyltransferase
MGNRVCQLCGKPLNKQSDNLLCNPQEGKWVKQYHIYCYEQLREQINYAHESRQNVSNIVN